MLRLKWRDEQTLSGVGFVPVYPSCERAFTRKTTSPRSLPNEPKRYLDTRSDRTCHLELKVVTDIQDGSFQLTISLETKLQPELHHTPPAPAPAPAEIRIGGVLLDNEGVRHICAFFSLPAASDWCDTPTALVSF